LPPITTKVLPRLAPPQERGKYTHKPVLCGDLRPSTKVYGGGVKDKIFNYIVKGNFSKIIAFIGMIRKFLNMVEAHIRYKV
jgi:hypothetical protein